MKILLGLVLAFFLSSGSLANAEDEVLTVGVEPTVQPFVIYDELKDTYDGFDVKLIRQIAQKAGFSRVEFVKMPFDALIPAVITEQVDVAISDISITEERSLVVNFIGPYYKSGLNAMINSRYRKEVKNINDLGSMSVCVKEGTTCEEYAMSFPSLNLVKTQKEYELFDNLGKGVCDAVICDDPVIKYYFVVHKGDQRYYSFKTLLSEDEFGIVTALHRPDLSERLNQAFQSDDVQEFMKSLSKKWFGKR